VVGRAGKESLHLDTSLDASLGQSEILFVEVDQSVSVDAYFSGGALVISVGFEHQTIDLDAQFQRDRL
jgi:hypothetical protein